MDMTDNERADLYQRKSPARKYFPKPLRLALIHAIEDDNEFYFQKLREFAETDVKAIELILRYTIPLPQATYEFYLPAGPCDVSERIEAILQAIATGKLPPESGARLLDSLGRLAQLDAIQAIEKIVKEMVNDNRTRETMPAIDAAIETLQQLQRDAKRR